MQIPGSTPGVLQTLLREFEEPELLAAHDEYICRECGDLVQNILRVQTVGQAFLLHFQRFENEWFAIGTALFISTVIALSATALLMELVVRSRHSTRGQSTDDA